MYFIGRGLVSSGRLVSVIRSHKPIILIKDAKWWKKGYGTIVRIFLRYLGYDRNSMVQV